MNWVSHCLMRYPWLVSHLFSTPLPTTPKKKPKKTWKAKQKQNKIKIKEYNALTKISTGVAKLSLPTSDRRPGVLVLWMAVSPRGGHSAGPGERPAHDTRIISMQVTYRWKNSIMKWQCGGVLRLTSVFLLPENWIWPITRLLRFSFASRNLGASNRLLRLYWQKHSISTTSPPESWWNECYLMDVQSEVHLSVFSVQVVRDLSE